MWQRICILWEKMHCKGFVFCGRTCIAEEFVGEHAHKGFCGQTYIAKGLHFVGEQALQRILWVNMHCKGFAFCWRTGIAMDFVGEHAVQRICILGRTGIAMDFVGEHALQRIRILWENRHCKAICG